MSGMRFRPSALFPLALSVIAFALILELVLSGINVNSVPDGYLFSFNTTSVGQNLVQFSSASATTPAANISSRSIIANSTASDTSNSSTSNSSKTNSTASIPGPANLNSSILTSPNVNSSSSTSTVPTLVIPQAAPPTNPAAIPISLIGAFFQLALNTFASGMGQTLQGIVSLLVTTSKQSLGVSQFYTMHISGICEGTVFNATSTNLTSPFNLTRCISYDDAGAYIANLTRNVSDSTLIAALNITLPALTKVPGIGRSTKSFIDFGSTIVLVVFIISLIGNGFSIILSVAAFVAPSNGKIHAAGAGISMLSTQMLQIATFTSTGLAGSLSSTMNNFSDVSGLSVAVGGKFLAFIWIGYTAAQIANGYWIATWFVKFRTTSYKVRQRTPQQMQAGYKGIKKEVLSDIRLSKVEYEETESLTKGQMDIQHWNDPYKQM